ncbi:hypothetical protein MHO82_18230 [Vibrio sp. Of7-15]|uniref:hypothetical protein n=1 Tax=Vibrio sp. Of7-15 TaxID=2724879 RepID=UPI001EF214DF|nr:hypothetical protein [Vibrio sp. Of7-15]MCG7498810.1 hypothetical protein [Vibrio sp. Of7-15]
MNKKLKKKRFPECNDAYKEALTNKVLDAEVVYEWKNIIQLKLKFRLFIIVPILIGFFGCAFLTRTTPEISIMLVILGILLGSFINFIAYAKRDYLCQITPYGIRRYETEQVPEGFYKVTRGFAYVGIVACVIAVIFVGPMAFVGAGASALMAFQMRHFHKNTEVIVKPFDSNATYEYNSDDNLLEESCLENGVVLYGYVIPEYRINGNENLTALYYFHWISFYCTQKQYPEIHDVITRYITATLEKDEEEEAVTQ